jgi:serine/threonine protein kinase
MDENEFKTIDRYETIDLIGRGGMGSVYLARDPLIDRYVAVKVLDVALDSIARERFNREARASGRLHHPNIVTIFDVGEHQGRPFIAMEYVPGQTLAMLIRQGQLGLAEKLRLMADACVGLAHAHRASIIHLDVKPANFVRHDSGVLKILDFGIARVLAADTTRTEHVLGTMRYMAPEQATGQTIDRRTDVFALGCVLYEVIAGVPAFKGTYEELISRITKPIEASPLSDVVPGVHPELVRMTRRAMANNPDERYDDLEVLKREIDGLLRNLTGPQEPMRLVLQSNADASGNAGHEAPARGAGTDRSSAALKRPAPGDDQAAGVSLRFPGGRRPAVLAALVIGLVAASAGVLYLVDTSRLLTDTGLSDQASTAPPLSAAPQLSADTSTAAAVPSPSQISNGNRAQAVGTGDAADLEGQVWRLIATRDREAALRLLRAQPGRLSKSFVNELVTAARTSVNQTRLNAEQQDPIVASSQTYRAAMDQFNQGTALLGRGQSVDGIAALWLATDLFARAGNREARSGSLQAAGAERSASSIDEKPLAPGPPASTALSEPPVSGPGDASPPDSRPAEAAAIVAARPKREGETSPADALAPEEAIRTLLKAYEAAYDERDPAALRRIFPGLSAEQLGAITRTFADAVSYDVEVQVLATNISGSTATATCLVTHALVPKIGSASRNPPQETRFHLRQASAGWVIERIERTAKP